jgi:hypothetical protein
MSSPSKAPFAALRRVKSQNGDKQSDEIPETLANFAVNKFDIKAIETYAGPSVAQRFRQCLIDGSNTSPEDMKEIETALFNWASTHNCIHYAHW